MARHKRMIERDNGWSDWVQPVMRGYKMACCDCGAVHDMEFMALQRVKDMPNGMWEANTLDPETYRVEFRARRNERSTAAVRRHKKP